MKKEFSFSIDGQKYVFNGNNFRLFQGKELAGSEKEELPIRRYVPSLRTLALAITNNCNLGCHYCYANKGEWDKPGEKMSFETARRAVDLLAGSVLKNNNKMMTVSFFGGEPLLRFDFIREVVQYAEKIYQHLMAVRFAVVTNGTLLSAEVSDFLGKYKFVISLSIDGTKESHDKCRVFKSGSESSYDRLVRNLGNIPSNAVILGRLTVSNHNFDINSAVRHVHSLGIDRMSYELDHNLSHINVKNFLASSEELLHYYSRCIRKGEYFDLRNITRLIATILFKRRSKSHCNAGTGYMCVSADGLLYPCHRFIGLQELVLGRIDCLDMDDLQQLVYTFDETLGTDAGQRNKKCHNCPFTFLCGGNCFYHSYLKEGNFFQVIPEDCLFKRYSFIQALRLMSSLTHEEWKKYLAFLKTVWAEEDRIGNLPNP